ncbi:ABC transporter substrate-binding protein [Georgenia sp. EYE_87]|uniref:ABC transporter substrate-binding protein n=1 Tax=Georgenia sp. EYE_87 TaxID=2853448 RepID=UPI002003D2C7|nr:ABC transporter substrate-binding protein [Georgenia sp. EYE_87]MCK6210095.1 ABC transporter substrate-binding protein [Georgenia sp. EYE_87]
MTYQEAKMPLRRRSIILIAAASVLATTAACGSSAGSAPEAEGSAAETIPLTVGILTSLDVAPAYLAEELGMFDEHGLDVTFEIAEGGAALLPSVVSGQYDIGFSNPVSLAVARGRGMDVTIIAAGSASLNEEPDYSAVLVNGQSTLTSAKELEGKTVAVNTLAGNAYVTTRQSIRAAGGDPDKVNFVELNYPDMVPALAESRVDAAFAVEPFVSLHKDAGNKVLSWPFLDTSPNNVAGVYFAMQQTVEQQPDAVERFTAAISEASKFASENPDEVRAQVSNFTEMDEELTAKVLLPQYPESVNAESIRTQAELAQKDGLVEAPIDVDELIAAN